MVVWASARCSCNGVCTFQQENLLKPRPQFYFLYWNELAFVEGAELLLEKKKGTKQNKEDRFCLSVKVETSARTDWDWDESIGYDNVTMVSLKTQIKHATKQATESRFSFPKADTDFFKTHSRIDQCWHGILHRFHGPLFSMKWTQESVFTLPIPISVKLTSPKGDFYK